MGTRNIKVVYHPGIYIKEAIEELNMSQDEFANRLGISGKQISKIINAMANITSDIAFKLSEFFGTSMEVWNNLQVTYEKYLYEVESEKRLEEDLKYYKMVNNKFLKEIKLIGDNDDKESAIKKLKIALPASRLSCMAKEDLYSYYRTSTSDQMNEKNIVCRNVWVSLALNFARKIKTSSFDEKKLKDNLEMYRNMTVQDPKDFFSKLVVSLSECGVRFVVLPYLPCSNTSGVVRWLDDGTVAMALNTRSNDSDKFWFTFFHEIKHIFQKNKRRAIIESEDRSKEIENEADIFAQNVLIPNKEEYLEFAKGKLTKQKVIEYAKKINIHPGIVVGRLQKEKYINYTYFNDLKSKYTISI